MSPPLPDGEAGHRPPGGPGGPGGNVAQYLFAHFRLDLETHQLLRNDEAVLLSAKAWDTLLVLLANRHRVVGKDELLALVWPGKHVSDDLLPQNILALRRALGDDSGQPKFIATTPRRGYRFIAPVTVVPLEHGRDTAHLPQNDATEGALHEPHAHVESTPPPSPDTSVVAEVPAWRNRPLTWVVAGAAAVAIAFAMTRRGTVPDPIASGRPLRFSQLSPEGTTFVSGGTISPNSLYLAFVAEDEAVGKTSLWVRTLDSGESRKLDGTDDAAKPFWSPDSQNLGFFANGKLKRIGIEGGAPRTLADVGLSPAGGSWSARGVILFAPWKSGITRIAEAGGPVTVLTTPNHEAQEAAHLSPQFLPDGRHFLYYTASADAEQAGTYVGSTDETIHVRVAGAPVTYAPPGYLLGVRDATLLAQAFDADELKTTGTPVLIASNVPANLAVSGSEGRLLTFGGLSSGNKLMWLSRTGQMIGTIDAPAHLHNPAFSPDLKQLVASSSDVDQRGVWLIDLERDAPIRVMPYGTSPWVSPDGRRIVFTSDRIGGVADVYGRSTAGRDDEQVVLRTPENKIVNDWTTDGRYIVFVSTNPVTKKDIWLLPQTGETRKPIPYLQTPANEIQAQVSPDGRWMAYASDESGAWQVYVETFPVPGRKRVVSVNGGAQPRWRGDGRELFYLSPNHTLMAVDITPGESLEPGQPHVLFHADLRGRLNSYRSHYTVTADGQRFVVDSMDGGQTSLTTIVNWTALLNTRN